MSQVNENLSRIKQKIINEKTNLSYKEFSYFINKSTEDIENEIVQEMYVLYKKFKGKKKSGINKGFLLKFLKNDYIIKTQITKDLKIPASTRRLWNKKNPCNFFIENIDFFKKIIYLKKQKNNFKIIKNLILKHSEAKNNKNLEKFLRNIPLKERNLLFSYLVCKELNELKISQRSIIYLLKRHESDYSEWKKSPPTILVETIMASEGKLIRHKTYSQSNLKKLIEIKLKIKMLGKKIGKDRIIKILETYKNYSFGKKYLNFIRNLNDIGNLLEKIKRKKRWCGGQIPNCIFTLLKIERLQLHRLPKELLARLLGWGFGDGGLNERLGYYFICGKKQDLLRIKEYLKKQLPREFKFTLKINNGNSEIINTSAKGIKTKAKFKKNQSWILYLRDSAFARFLYSIGLPRGERVLQKFNIPPWIMKGNKRIKSAFLEALFEGELQKGNVYFDKKRNKFNIAALNFSLNKIKEHIVNLKELLEEIKMLLLDLGIKSSEIEKPRLGTIRKDGNITYSCRFNITPSAQNMVKLRKEIKFCFNEEKKRGINMVYREAIKKLKNFRKRSIKYKKANILYSRGLTIPQITKELNANQKTIENWLIEKRLSL